MADTRIEDRRRAFTADAKAAHPDWTEAQIKKLVDREIKDSIAGSQTGSQIWMNRPVGLTEEEYTERADKIKAMFTEDELAEMSTAESAQAFVADPAAYLARWAKYDQYALEFLRSHP